MNWTRPGVEPQRARAIAFGEQRSLPCPAPLSRTWPRDQRDRAEPDRLLPRPTIAWRAAPGSARRTSSRWSRLCPGHRRITGAAMQRCADGPRGVEQVPAARGARRAMSPRRGRPAPGDFRRAHPERHSRRGHGLHRKAVLAATRAPVVREQSARDCPPCARIGAAADRSHRPLGVRVVTSAAPDQRPGTASAQQKVQRRRPPAAINKAAPTAS